MLRTIQSSAFAMVTMHTPNTHSVAIFQWVINLCSYSNFLIVSKQFRTMVLQKSINNIQHMEGRIRKELKPIITPVHWYIGERPKAWNTIESYLWLLQPSQTVKHHHCQIVSQEEIQRQEDMKLQHILAPVSKTREQSITCEYRYR